MLKVMMFYYFTILKMNQAIQEVEDAEVVDMDGDADFTIKKLNSHISAIQV